MKPRVRPSAEKLVLIEQVTSLCRKFDRPVSSKDLLQLWKQEPSTRPALLQAPGQLLIKAARDRPEGWGQIYRIGLIGNLCFYAPEETNHWKDMFDRHLKLSRLRVAQRRRVPDWALTLIDGHYMSLAQNSLAGWLHEYTPLLRDHSLSSWLSDSDLPRQVEIATEFASKTFIPCPPSGMIARNLAQSLLLALHRKRTLPLDPGRLSVNRHLAKLKWPRSGLFTQTGFSSQELHLYARSKWPYENENPLEARAVLECLAYGIHGASYIATSQTSRA